MTMHVSRVKPAVLESTRIDPDFYQLAYLESEDKVRQFGAERLGTVGKFFAGPFGSKLPSNLYLDSGIPLFRVGNVGSLEVSYEGMAYLAPSIHGELAASRVQPGDLLIVKASVSEKICKVPASMPEANITQHIIALRAKQGNDVDFLCAFLFCRFGRNQLIRRSLGSIIQYLGISDARTVLFPVVSKNCQAYVGDKVRNAEAMRYLALKLRAQISREMEKCFRGASKPAGSKFSRISPADTFVSRLEAEFYDPVALWADQEIQNSQWPSKPLHSLAKRIKDGPGGWGVSTDDYVSHGVPVIRGVDLVSGDSCLDNAVFITPEKHRQLYGHRAVRGSVLLSVRGTIGRSAVFDVPGYSEASLNAAVVTIDCTEEVLPHYLAEFFSTEVGQIQSNRLGNGAVQQNMNLTETGSNSIVVPPPEFQRNISEIRQRRILTQRFALKLVDSASFLVEALVEGKISDNELSVARASLEQGDRSSDQAILSRLYEGGIDATDTRPLFPDLDAYYETLQMAEQALSDGGGE